MPPEHGRAHHHAPSVLFEEVLVVQSGRANDDGGEKSSSGREGARAGQPRLFWPRTSRLPALCSDYADHPNRAIDGKGTRTPQIRQTCWLLRPSSKEGRHGNQAWTRCVRCASKAVQSDAEGMGTGCTNRRTRRENVEKLVQQFPSNKSYLASSSLLPKLSVEGSIPFARSNIIN